jgi:hypothetical protein
MSYAWTDGLEIRSGALALLSQLRQTMNFDVLWQQVVWLFVLPLAIACVSWTVTHEEIFREAREYCVERSRSSRTLFVRKLFYVATCEYCFSHWVTLGFLLMTGYRLLLTDWRGAIIGFYALVAVANIYLSAYGRLRVDIKAERVHIAAAEKRLEVAEREASEPATRH